LDKSCAAIEASLDASRLTCQILEIIKETSSESSAFYEFLPVIIATGTWFGDNTPTLFIVVLNKSVLSKTSQSTTGTKDLDQEMIGDSQMHPSVRWNGPNPPFLLDPEQLQGPHCLLLTLQ
jgi:hypothetical protein